MTKIEFMSMVNANGGPDKLFCIIFDNDYRIRFTEDHPFKESMMVTYGETDFIVRDLVVARKSTHRVELPVKTFYNMNGIQYVQFVNEVEDKKDIDPTVYMDLR